jgi:hypothetical protein
MNLIDGIDLQIEKNGLWMTPHALSHFRIECDEPPSLPMRSVMQPRVPGLLQRNESASGQTGSIVIVTVIDSSPPPCRTPLIGGQAL